MLKQDPAYEKLTEQQPFWALYGCFSESKGRGLKVGLATGVQEAPTAVKETKDLNTTEPLPTGFVVFRCIPYVTLLRSDLWESHCFYCFGPLKQAKDRQQSNFDCVGCTRVRFCSGKCLRNGAQDHAQECPYIASFIEFCAQKALSTDKVMDWLLLARLLRKKALEEKKFSISSPGSRASNTSLQLHQYTEPFQPRCGEVEGLCVMGASPAVDLDVLAYMLSNNLFPQPTDQGEETVQAWFSAFKCNNFAITDALFNACGSGVYPFGSLLNHSCAPNCLVTYEGPDHVQVCRSLRPLHPDEELYISYTDVVLPIAERRVILLDAYNFLCQCDRCAYPSESARALDRALRGDRWNRPAPQIDHPLVSCYGPNRAEDKDNACSIEPVFTPPPQRTLLTLLQKAASCFQRMAQVEYQTDLQLKLCLRGICLLEQVLHPMNLDLYKKRCEAFSLLLDLDDQPEALKIGAYLTQFLEEIYQSVPYHPLVSLHYFTIGDLHFELKQFEEAFTWHLKALDAMRVAYGSAHPFIDQLQERLSHAKRYSASQKN